MTEYQALMIDGNNVEVLGYFVEQLINENPMMSPQQAENMVRVARHEHPATGISRHSQHAVWS